MPGDAGTDDTAADHQAQAFAGEVIDHREDPEPSTVGQRIAQEIQRPAPVRPLRDRHWRPGAGRPLTPTAATADVCRKHGISSATFYKWKAKFGGLDVSDARRLRALEDENAKLKRLLAEAMLDNAMLKDIAAKKW